MAIQTQLITAEELERMPQDDAHVELVKGEVVKMTPAGYAHGKIAQRIGSRLLVFVEEHKLGEICAAETGFILSRNPDTVRAPDVAFVSSGRDAQQTRSEGFFDGAPDLAAEVVSPNDRDEDIEEKVLDFLRAGTKLVWVIHPRTKTITAYRSLTNIRVLTQDDTLDGDDVLPGFDVPVKEIFK